MPPAVDNRVDNNKTPLYNSAILDFDRVLTVGQAFADEIFRVFQSRHPSITITPVNMNDTVRFMIGRVEEPQI